MTSKEASTKRFINRIGFSLHVDATLWVTAESLVGSSTISLSDTLGLHVGDSLYYSDQVLKIASILPKSITTAVALANDLPKDHLLVIGTDSKFILIDPGKEIARDSLAGTKYIRTPSDLVISYASIVTYENDKYFVTSYQKGDSSLSIKLRLANELLDWYSTDSSFDTAEQSLPEDAWPVSDWPKTPGLKPVKTGILAYSEPAAISSSLQDAGSVPSLSRLYFVPLWWNIQVGDSLKTVDGMIRVLGKDCTRARGFQALTVNYYKGAET